MALTNLATRDAAGALAMDSRGLAALRQQAKAAPGESLRAVAGQFEALFMQMLLKSMREALPQDGPFASETTKTYTAMFDQQMAQELAKKGVGIADMLVRQLSRQDDRSSCGCRQGSTGNGQGCRRRGGGRLRRHSGLAP